MEEIIEEISSILQSSMSNLILTMEEVIKEISGFLQSDILIPILVSMCFGLAIIVLMCFVKKKFRAASVPPSIPSKRTEDSVVDEHTDHAATEDCSTPTVQESFAVLQNNSPELSATKKKKKKKKQELSEETSNLKAKIEETDSSLNEIMKSEENVIKELDSGFTEITEITEFEENILKVISKEFDSEFDDILESNEDIIEVNEEDYSCKKESEKEAYDDSEVQLNPAFTKEPVFEEEVDDKDPPRKYPKGSGKKFTFFISNVPPGTEPEAIKAAIDEIVGEDKVSNFCEISKLQSIDGSFATVFSADVSDHKTLKVLLELEPKLNINGQKLIIEKSETNETKKAGKETRFVYISQIPVHACDESVLQTALEERIGQGKVLSVRCAKNRVTGEPEGVATAYCTDVETAQLLVQLRPKLRIDDQELIIEEDKGKRIVFISHIPFHACNEGTVRSALEAKVGRGKVFNVRFPKDNSTGRARGIATAYCANAETAKTLLRFNFKIKIAGKKIKIVEYEPTVKKSKDNVLKVSISNLPAKVTGEALSAEILEVVGDVDFLEIELPLAKDAGKSQRFAIVNLTSEEAVKKLLALHQKLEVGGSKIHIHGCVKGSSHYSNSGDEEEGRNKDYSGYESGRRDASSSSGAPSQDSSYRSGRPSAHESVSSSDSSNFNQGQVYEDRGNSDRSDWRRRAHKGVHDDYGASDVSAGQGQQGHDNSSRSRSSRASESTYSSDSSDTNQDWDHEAHGNSSHVGRRQQTHEQHYNSDPNVYNRGRDHQNYARTGWRQKAYESAQGQNNVGDGDYQWDHQRHDYYRGGGGRHRAYGSDHGDRNYRGRGNRRHRGYSSAHDSNDYNDVDQRAWEDQGYYKGPNRYHYQRKYD